MRDPVPTPAKAAAADAALSDPMVGDAGPADQRQAAQGPVPGAVSAAANPLPSARRPDSPAEARGRRIVSTAFVRIAAGGTLTVEQHDGRTVVLREVVMGPRQYCGLLVGARRGRYCGDYANVAAARPSGPAAPPTVDAR